MEGRYRAYPEYKDSGVEWLRKVPIRWELRKSKYLFSRVQRDVRPGDDIVTAFRDGQVTLRSNRRIDGFTNAVKEIGYQGVRKGDLVVHAMDGFAGAIGICDSDGKCSPVCSVCIPKEKECIYMPYYGYLARQLAVTDYIVSLAKGIRERSTEFRFNEFAVLTLPFPSFVEQQNIANFLDHETAKIDTLIDKQQQLIALLKEKRQAVISHAVTKGLNPDAPMKDSGVEWLGEVPEHWDVVMLGKKIQLQRGVDITKDQQSPGEIPVVSSGGISSYHDCPTCQGPGVVVGRKGTAGKLHYIDTDFWAHDTTLYVKEFRGNFPRYVYYKLVSMQLETYDTGSANPTLNRNIIHPVKVSWCPLIEQQEIAAYLDHFCLQAEQVTERANCAIQLLQERRTALISAAVTGKIDVRNWQPPTANTISKDAP